MPTLTSKRSLLFIAILIAGVVLIAVYGLFDPEETAWMPRCPVNFLTGLDCPGCGSQRAFHALIHGNFRAAWEANAFIICFTPVLVLLLLTEWQKKRWPRLFRLTSDFRFILGILVVIALWTIFRNIL